MKIEIIAYTDVTCHIDLTFDEKFLYRAGWWDRRAMWVNHVNITWEAFTLFGDPDRESDRLGTVSRDRFQNVHFRRADEVHHMPVELQRVIEAKKAELRAAHKAGTLPDGVTANIG